jgi:hypothetical protein
MQSGSVGQGVNQGFTPGIKPVKLGSAGQAAAQPPVEVPQEVETPKEEVTLAARFKTTVEDMQIEDLGNGQQRSNVELALVPKQDKEKFAAMGVVFPEVEEVRSNAGLQPDGRLELVPLDGTGNPETTHILQTLEVPKAALEPNADGLAPIDSMTARLLAEGETVLPKDWVGAPQGYDFKLGTSAEGARTEKKRLRLNSLSDGLGGFAQSSLAGVITLPYVSSVAPIVALGTAGATMNKHYEALKEAQDHLAYVQGREKYSKTDLVTLEAGTPANPISVPVSAEAEKKRTELKIRNAKSKLASTGLLGAAGASSVVGYAAAGGMFGTGAMAATLTGAVAATPYLAGAAMIIGSGGMVLNSLSELKTLSKEKAELEAALAKGETHVLKTIEKVLPEAGRPIAVGEHEVPISERLKTVTKEQRKHRLLATAMTGGIGSIAGTVAAGASALAIAPLALAPAGVLAGAQSVARLRELSQEKKELTELHKSGATMVPRQVERQDGSWGEEKVPISTLLKDIEKKQKTNKLILTAAASGGAMLGMTVGLGLGAGLAAGVLILPALVGAALFPDKVKEFAGKVAGLITGRFSEANRSRKELTEQATARTEEAKAAINSEVKELFESNPELFKIPSKAELKQARADGTPVPIGYFPYLEQLMDNYAEAGSRVARFQAMQEIEQLLAQAPAEAQSTIPAIRERLKELHMDTEAGWVARDVMLEMKKKTTDKVVQDGNVKERLTDLGYPTEDIRSQYEQSLYIDNDPNKLQGLLTKSRSGDREATLELARKEVFAAARLYYQSQEELGSELHAKLLDALKRPQDEENLELVIKEVNHKLGRPMSPSTDGDRSAKWWLDPSTQGSESGLNEPLRLADFGAIQQASNLLEKPLDINGTLSQDQASLEGPQARMASAFRELHSVDAKAASQLGQAFATLNDPAAFEGLTPEQVQQKKLEAGLQLTKAKSELEAKAPELVGLWDKARLDVEEEYFQRSIDQDFAEQVLAHSEVGQATERLGLQAEDTRALYMGLLRSHVTGDSRALHGQLLDASGKEIDPKKAELLEVLDQAMTSLATQQLQGGNDTVAPQAALGDPDSDPAVASFLQANPQIDELLKSDQVTALADELQTSPEEVRQAYLTLVQANLNPVLTAEFDGLYSGGDLQTVRTFQIGSRVGQLVQAALRPSAEQLAGQLDAVMQDPGINSILSHPDIVERGAQLQVDNQALMRTLLVAELTGDASALQEMQLRAQNGEPAAQAELQMLQTLAQAVQQLNNGPQPGGQRAA